MSPPLPGWIKAKRLGARGVVEDGRVDPEAAEDDACIARLRAAIAGIKPIVEELRRQREAYDKKHPKKRSPAPPTW